MKRYIKASSGAVPHTFVDYVNLKQQYDNYIRKILPNFTYVDAEGRTQSAAVYGVPNSRSNSGKCNFYLGFPEFLYNRKGDPVELTILFQMEGSPEYNAIITWGADGMIDVHDTEDDFKLFYGSTSFSNYRDPEITLETLFDYITPSVLKENVSSILDKAYDYREQYERQKLQNTKPKRTKLGGPTYVTYKYGNGENWPDQFQRAYDKTLKKLGLQADSDSYGVTLYYEDDPDYTVTIENDEFEGAFMDYWQSSKSVAEFNKNIEQYISMYF